MVLSKFSVEVFGAIEMFCRNLFVLSKFSVKVFDAIEIFCRNLFVIEIFCKKLFASYKIENVCFSVLCLDEFTFWWNSVIKCDWNYFYTLALKTIILLLLGSQPCCKCTYTCTWLLFSILNMRICRDVCMCVCDLFTL